MIPVRPAPVTTMRLRFTSEISAPAGSAADRVFAALYEQVVTLALPPGTRLSEAEVARAAGVSRQPVRDAFGRLSQLGLLTIRPQRATEVSAISEAAVLRARFLRTALEVETVRAAASRLTASALAELDALLLEQREAVASEPERFHRLDDAFHRRICELADAGFAWDVIRDNKAHMDRVRFLSLSFGAATAVDDHRRILDALRRGDGEAAATEMRRHLGRITEILDRIRTTHPGHFTAVEA